jgi:hypothetical protein
MRHAASVRSEPGSNSPKKTFILAVRFGRKDSYPLGIDPFSIAYARYLVFKDPFPLFTKKETSTKKSADPQDPNSDKHPVFGRFLI